MWKYKTKRGDPLGKKVEKDPDIVMTKDNMAIHLISKITFKKGDVVLDPCKGKGAFYNNFPHNVTKKWCEINEGIDFLSFNDQVDITLSNPPFVPRKLFWEFHRHAMEITKREIWWLINMCSFNVFTPKRLNECADEGWFLNSIHIVADKRWFGRYVWIKFSRDNVNFVSWENGSF